MENYKTIKGAKQRFKRLAIEFKMDQAAQDKLDSCKTIEEIEHVWKGLLDRL